MYTMKHISSTSKSQVFPKWGVITSWKKSLSKASMVIFLSYKSLILEFNAHPRCLLTTFYGSLHFIRTLVVPLLKQWEVWPPASMLKLVNNCESLRLNHGARAPSGGMAKSSLSPVSILCVTYALTYSNMAGMRVQLSLPTGNPVV